MKKQDFIKVVASKAGLSQDAVSKALASFIEVITAELKKGGEVNITGFGAIHKLEKLLKFLLWNLLFSELEKLLKNLLDNFKNTYFFKKSTYFFCFFPEIVL